MSDGPWKVYSARHERLLGHLRMALELDRDGRPKPFTMAQSPPIRPGDYSGRPFEVVPTEHKHFGWDERLGGLVAPQGVYWSNLRGFEPL